MPTPEPDQDSVAERLWADLPLTSPEYQTELANSERFVRMHGEQLRFCHKLNQWVAWDGKRWVRDARHLAMRRAKETGREILNATKQTSAAVFGRSSSSRHAFDSMLTLAAVHQDLAIDPGDLDSDPLLLNCSNGTFDLRTMRLSQHDPLQLQTKLCPVDYEPGAVSPEWEQFLESVMPDAEHRQFLQRWFGYCLTGETTEHTLLIFLGSGANGKSTLLDVIQAVLGEDYTIQCSPDLLVDKPRDSHPTNRMDLFGCRLAVSTETELDQKLAESQLKQLTGGDNLRGRQMRQDNWQFVPTHKMILCTNHMPKLSGNDDAVWRRIVVVPFSQTFWNPDSDVPGPMQLRQVKGLPKKLKAAAAAILNWMVEGCREWQSKGLRVPESLQRIRDEHRCDVDVVRRFVENCCDVGEGRKVPASDLQTEFRRFCDLEHMRITPQVFAQRLQKLGFEKRKNSRDFYHGLAIKPPSTEELRLIREPLQVLNELNPHLGLPVPSSQDARISEKKRPPPPTRPTAPIPPIPPIPPKPNSRKRFPMS